MNYIYLLYNNCYQLVCKDLVRKIGGSILNSQRGRDVEMGMFTQQGTGIAESSTEPLSMAPCL